MDGATQPKSNWFCNTDEEKARLQVEACVFLYHVTASQLRTAAVTETVLTN